MPHTAADVKKRRNVFFTEYPRSFLVSQQQSSCRKSRTHTYFINIDTSCVTTRKMFYYLVMPRGGYRRQLSISEKLESQHVRQKTAPQRWVGINLQGGRLRQDTHVVVLVQPLRSSRTCTEGNNKQIVVEIYGAKPQITAINHIISCPTMRASHFRGGECASDSPAKVTLKAAPPPTPNAGYTVPLIRMTASSSPWPRAPPPRVKKSIGRSVKSKATPITSPSLSCFAKNRRQRRERGRERHTNNGALGGLCSRALKLQTWQHNQRRQINSRPTYKHVTLTVRSSVTAKDFKDYHSAAPWPEWLNKRRGPKHHHAWIELDWGCTRGRVLYRTRSKKERQKKSRQVVDSTRPHDKLTVAAAPPSDVENPQVFSPSPSFVLASSSPVSSSGGGLLETPRLTVPPGGRHVTVASLVYVHVHVHVHDWLYRRAEDDGGQTGLAIFNIQSVL